MASKKLRFELKQETTRENVNTGNLLNYFFTEVSDLHHGPVLAVSTRRNHPGFESFQVLPCPTDKKSPEAKTAIIHFYEMKFKDPFVSGTTVEDLNSLEEEGPQLDDAKVIGKLDKFKNTLSDLELQGST
jgi:hypothetical protein